MKTKVDKKGKKRSLSSSLSTKPAQKQENVSESKKSPKKAKLASFVQNGNSTMENKSRILKKMYKPLDKQKAKQQINIGQPLIAEVKTGGTKLPKFKEESVTKKTKENKLENLKKKQAKRGLHKRKRKHLLLNAATITLSIEEIEAKIEEIRNREVLSKRAKKILAALNRKLKYEKSANKSEKLNITEKKSNKKNKQQIGALVKIKQESNEDNEDKIKVKKEYVEQKVEVLMDDDSNEDDEDESDEDQSDIEKEESMDNANEQFDDESDEEEEEDEEDEDDEDDIDEKANISKVKKEDVKKMKKQATQPLDDQKKKQYVLFVSNLPLDVTADELKQHFLTKIDTVTSVKIQIKSDTKIPYGFAHVEVTNSTDFEKGLSLHHTFLKNRRLNVQVAKSNITVKNFAIAKNKKLQVLQKPKKLALDRNQGKKKSLKKDK